MAEPIRPASKSPAARQPNAGRLAARLALLAMAAVLLAPSAQAWVMYQYNPLVHVDVDVDYQVDLNGQSSVGATVLVCSQHEGYDINVATDPGIVSVWTPESADPNDGSTRTTAGCETDDDLEESPVDVTVCGPEFAWCL